MESNSETLKVVDVNLHKVGKLIRHSYSMEQVFADSTQWYYESKGTRKGPIDSKVMLSLLNQSDIDANTLVWKHGLTNWIELGHSELASLLVHQNVPPPLSGDRISNTFVWILAFAPFVGVILEYFVATLILGIDAPPIALQNRANDLWYITFGLNILLCVLDEQRVKAAGHDTSKFGKLWLLLVPLYLFKRAKYLKQMPTYAWTWLVVFVLSLLMN